MTQNDRILDYIKTNGSISSREAVYDLGVMRLPSRIHELRQAGYSIVSEQESCLNRYGQNTHYCRYKFATNESVPERSQTT